MAPCCVSTCPDTGANFWGILPLLGQSSWRFWQEMRIADDRFSSSFLSSQGLFRIAAGASKLKKLKAALDCSTSQLEEFYSDPHAVAGKTSKKKNKHANVNPSGLNHFLIGLLFIHRSPEVLPQGTAGTADDLWAVRWMATGLLVWGHTHAQIWISLKTHTWGLPGCPQYFNVWVMGVCVFQCFWPWQEASDVVGDMWRFAKDTQGKL